MNIHWVIKQCGNRYGLNFTYIYHITKIKCMLQTYLIRFGGGKTGRMLNKSRFLAKFEDQKPFF